MMAGVIRIVVSAIIQTIQVLQIFFYCLVFVGYRTRRMIFSVDDLQLLMDNNATPWGI
jgi:hypothetical protein